MKCKCYYCNMGSCDCTESCEAKDLKIAYESDAGWVYWGADQEKQTGQKINLCENCRNACAMESEIILTERELVAETFMPQKG